MGELQFLAGVRGPSLRNMPHPMATSLKHRFLAHNRLPLYMAPMINLRVTLVSNDKVIRGIPEMVEQCTCLGFTQGLPTDPDLQSVSNGFPAACVG